MAWGGFLDKLLEKLPIQGRVERWKNEVEKLEYRQSYIKIHMLDDDKHAREYERNIVRLRKLHGLLKNKAE